jgi:hypothetical protein
VCAKWQALAAALPLASPEPDGGLHAQSEGVSTSGMALVRVLTEALAAVSVANRPALPMVLECARCLLPYFFMA